MNKLLIDKIAIVAGASGFINTSVVQTLLKEGATVIAPTKSAGENESLKRAVTEIGSGKLVTLLTDYPDYDKAFELAENIKEQFGKIDIAIICFDAVQPSVACAISETNIMDWEKMIDHQINAFFIAAAVVLADMKQHKNGMFISIMYSHGEENKKGTPLSGLAAYMQKEMAKIFCEEAKKYNVRCYHIAAYNSPDKVKTGANNAIGNLIMQLYNDETNYTESQFQKLTIAVGNN